MHQPDSCMNPSLPVKAIVVTPPLSTGSNHPNTCWFKSDFLVLGINCYQMHSIQVNFYTQNIAVPIWFSKSKNTGKTTSKEIQRTSYY